MSRFGEYLPANTNPSAGVTIHLPSSYGASTPATPRDTAEPTVAMIDFKREVSNQSAAPTPTAAAGTVATAGMATTPSPRAVTTLSTSSTTKDVREAYLSGDVAASVAAHMARKQALASGELTAAPETHGDAGYIKSIVYGGLDGIITAFALTASVSGADLPAKIVLVLGFAALFANGVGMGLGDALSEQAENDFNLAERKREKWEMDNNMEGEIDEMIDLYVKRNVSESDAAAVLHIMAKYPDVFLDHMMTEELRLLPLEADANPWKSGAVTFVSFVVFGFVPLIPYLIGLAGTLSSNQQFFIAIGLTGLVLFLLGAIKGYLVDKRSNAWLVSAFTTLVLGSIAAAIAYAIGFGLQFLVPSNALASASGA